jgi:hypothetical protein
MTAVLRSDLIDIIRQRAGMEAGPYPVTSQFVTDSELKLLADESARGLYDLLLTHQGQEYFATGADLLTAQGQQEYDLPSDFYQMLQLLVRRSDGLYFDAYPWRASDAAQLLNMGQLGGSQNGWLRYRIGGTQSTVGAPPSSGNRTISILPIPASVVTMTLRYVPVCVRADNTASDVYYDGVNGWEEWIIWDCVAKMFAKEESDPTFALMQRDQVTRRIQALAPSLDRAHPEISQDWQKGRRARAMYARRGGRRWMA